MSVKELENLLQTHLRAHKIPFAREVRFARPRLFRADFIIERQDGQKLIVEVQGGVWTKTSYHGSGRGMTADCEKSALAAIKGYQWMAVTGGQVRNGQAVAWIIEWRDAWLR